MNAQKQDTALVKKITFSKITKKSVEGHSPRHPDSEQLLIGTSSFAVRNKDRVLF